MIHPRWLIVNVKNSELERHGMSGTGSRTNLTIFSLIRAPLNWKWSTFFNQVFPMPHKKITCRNCMHDLTDIYSKSIYFPCRRTRTKFEGLLCKPIRRIVDAHMKIPFSAYCPLSDRMVKSSFRICNGSYLISWEYKINIDQSEDSYDVLILTVINKLGK